MTELAKPWKEEEGFTVVELLAAMVVSSLVVGFVLSMYLFSERVMARQQKRSNVRDEVFSCAQRIVADIESSTEMERCDDTSLVLRQNPLKEIKYHFDASRILRDGTSMNDPPIELNARVSFDEDTLSTCPKRLWSLHIVGWHGNIRDSVNVCISAIISSQELVDHEMSQAAR